MDEPDRPRSRKNDEMLDDYGIQARRRMNFAIVSLLIVGAIVGSCVWFIIGMHDGMN